MPSDWHRYHDLLDAQQRDLVARQNAPIKRVSFRHKKPNTYAAPLSLFAAMIAIMIVGYYLGS